MKVTLSDIAIKEFDNLDKNTRDRVAKYLFEVANLSNPRDRGEPLKSNLKGFLRYRVGNYRIVCDIQDNELTTVSASHCS